MSTRKEEGKEKEKKMRIKGIGRELIRKEDPYIADIGEGDMSSAGITTSTCKNMNDLFPFWS